MGGEAAGARGRGSRAGKGVQPPAAQAPQARGAKRTRRSAALSTRRGGERWLVGLGPHPARHLSSLRDSGVSVIFRRRPVAAPAFVPGGKPARRARVGLRGEKKRGKGKGGRGEGKSGRRPRAPGEGPLGSQPCVQASKRASRCRGLGTRRDARIRTLADTEETSTWGPWRPVTPRDGSRAGSRPLPRHPAGSPREEAARPSSGF